MRLLLLLPLFLLTPLGAIGADKPRVSFEIVTKAGLSPTVSAQWYKALTDLGIAGLTIRSAKPADEMAVKEAGAKNARSYKVIGILGADGQLYLPGGKFSLHDAGRLRKWLENLGDAGSEGVTAPRGAFGLTPKQLEEVRVELARPVTFSTKGKNAAELVAKIASQLPHPLALGDARADLQVPAADELKGLSRGTALAALARVGGWGIKPERSGGELAYKLVRLTTDRECWPVGWKPDASGGKPLPELFDFLNVEIEETSVAEVLSALQQRLKAPLLLDHNALAMQNIDLAQVQAEVPAKRMTYSQVLGKVLFQARLKYELRLDDADRPFLWITTARPALSK
ncbi:MAG TPA: hypothetical protein VGJ16_06620 [Pirellulales bacterium]|jgi:hypothetical protein